MSWYDCVKHYESIGRKEVIDEVGIEPRVQFTKINWVRVFNGFLFEGRNPVFTDPTIAEDYSVLFELVTEKKGKKTIERFKNYSQVCSILDVFFAAKKKFIEIIDAIYGPSVGINGRKLQRRKDAILSAQKHPLLKQQYLLLTYECKFSCVHELSILAYGKLKRALVDTYGFGICSWTLGKELSLFPPVR